MEIFRFSDQKIEESPWMEKSIDKAQLWKNSPGVEPSRDKYQKTRQNRI